MERIHVVAGIIQKGGKVLLALRDSSAHQGDKWEFPGGKVEQGEVSSAALIRELQEELAITPTLEQCSHFHTLDFDYPDKHVRLEFWRVLEFKGTPQGAEGQPIKWWPISELKHLEFPEANQVIVDRLLSNA